MRAVRGRYGLARVSILRGTVAAALLWAGLLGGAAGSLVPVLVLNAFVWLKVGSGLLVLGFAAGLLHRRRLMSRLAADAERAGYAVTLEPVALTRARMRRAHGLWILAGGVAGCVTGIATGPALGMLLFGAGLGLGLSALLMRRQERRTERLVWAPVADGRGLARRRGALGPFLTTGPAAGRDAR